MSAPAAENPADPADRGRLAVHPVVLRKIVEYAADGTPGTLRHERRVAGIEMGTAGSTARVQEGDSDSVDVTLELTLRYPASVRGTVEAVRERVTEELTRIAGRRVRNLAVTVAGLHTGRPAADTGSTPRARVQ